MGKGKLKNFIMQLVQRRLIHTLTSYCNLADEGVELMMQYSCVIYSTLPWQPRFTGQHGVGKGDTVMIMA